MIKVLLVDDAVVVRHVLKDTLNKDPDIEVIGTAADGQLALEKLKTLRPDLVVLDVEMPNMDGIETLAAIKSLYPKIKVIMFSTLTSRGAQATMDAMMSGADDYVTKPSNTGSMAGAIERINAELSPKIKGLIKGSHSTAQAPRRDLSRPLPASAPPAVVSTASRPVTRPKILAIAVSTGGPNALAELLPKLPANLAVPVVIVQHIPPVFSKALADRLNLKCALEVKECEDGAELRAGQIWIAPGDFHMVVEDRAGIIRLATNQNPPENSCRPAADVLFRSVVSVYGAATLAVVLTGMGYDGLKGAQGLVAAGGQLLAQDEASSVVWGMPGAVVNAGIVNKVLPLQEIAGEIITRAGLRATESGVGFAGAKR